VAVFEVGIGAVQYLVDSVGFGLSSRDAVELLGAGVPR